MKALPKEAWRYAILLITLFAIAACAVWRTISYLSGHLSDASFGLVAGLIWALTMGFMLIAGAFGLWTIRLSAEAESRRRIGRFVDAMDYLKDGLAVVDRQGRISGSNPEARRLAGTDLRETTALDEAFPCLDPDDMDRLLKAPDPHEVERRRAGAAGPRTLRFRSQPTEDLALLLISDVTDLDARRARRRQLARLQLLGQVARGLAHDFNNMPCVIAGHASLLSRTDRDSTAAQESVSAINRAAMRGTLLATQLRQLVQTTDAEAEPTYNVGEHVESAAEVLRDSLPEGWEVKAATRPVAATALAGIQLEQIILNLGLLAAHASGRPGVVRISVAGPGDEAPDRISPSHVGALVIAAGPAGAPIDRAVATPGEALATSGAILAVVQSIVESSGGAVRFLSGVDGVHIYQVALPHAEVPQARRADSHLPSELATYLSNWNVLLARAACPRGALEEQMGALSMQVEEVHDIVSALARIEGAPSLDALIIEEHFFRREAEGLLKAILKLRPATAVVVLCRHDHHRHGGLADDVVFLDAQSTPDQILLAVMEAKNLAMSRVAGPRSGRA